MRKLTAVLALLALISSTTIVEARGGRTTAEDCDAGSVDPDCPDAPAANKSSSTSNGQQSAPAPPRNGGR